MPKHEALTPKAIANRIKAKGLQKLRWYCQMCQKQCRDENGFKCHTLSESHQRQLLLFAENPNKYLGEYSREFMVGFLELLRRRFGTKRVHANQVYQEYIADRHHLHMNATRWLSLTGFVKFLGREGSCIVDQTEKGWFITYVDRDPETLKKQENIAKKKKLDMDDEDRMAKFIERQVEIAAKAKEENDNEPNFTELKRDTEEEKVVFAMPAVPIGKGETLEASSSKLVNPLAKLDAEKRKSAKDEGPEDKKSKSALAEIMAEQEKVKERFNRRDYWLTEGIVVKVITKQLGEKYYKKKGIVQEVKDRYVALVKMQDTGDKVKLDQVHLETVIPAPGKAVLIVNGAYRGCKAILVDVDVDNFCATLKISSGPTRDRVIKGIQYEDFCKIDT